MQQSAVKWLEDQIKSKHWKEMFIWQKEEVFKKAKEMEKEQELKIKIQCFKESLQFIDDNYMVELLNIRIYNMDQELETFKSE